MNYFRLLLLNLIVIVLASCRTNEKYSFAIKDFKDSLHPYLFDILATGKLGYDSATMFVQTHATDEELVHLSVSEHPILRAVALEAILKRKNLNHFEILMMHLDDTCLITRDRGEFGLDMCTVTDDLIENSTWQTKEEKNKTIDKVISEHNYLRAAYLIAPRTGTQAKYYPYIKKMAHRELPFLDIEDALLALAAYKKPEDTLFLKETLQINSRKMTKTSFKLMQDYPLDSYLDILEDYAKKRFFSTIRDYNSRTDTWGEKREAIMDGFLNALASYKNARSAYILYFMLNKKTFSCLDTDSSQIKEKLRYAIWDNRCEAYAALIKQIQPDIEQYEKGILRITLNDTTFRRKPAEEIISW